jgi:NAD(P)-dependent dehydrogenase (short-subunit alcohol dehydrogenase family)
VHSEYGHLDVLINNAGTAAPRVGAEDLTAVPRSRGSRSTSSVRSGYYTRSCPCCRQPSTLGSSTSPAGSSAFERLLAPDSVENAVTLPVYPATNAARTMLTVRYARALDGILINAADPLAGRPDRAPTQHNSSRTQPAPRLPPFS